MRTYRVPPKHDTGRNVRGCSMTCDECGDQLELRAHGEGVRGERAKEVAQAMAESLHVLALKLRCLITSTGPGGVRHTCHACRDRAAGLRVPRSA